VTPLADRLRIMVLTDPRPACGRPLPEVVAECLEAGATTIQLRDKGATGAALLCQAKQLLRLTRAAGALLIVNDRLDVALACEADGVHLGPDDIPVAAARRLAPPGFLIGRSSDDPDAARGLALAGADYLGVGAVYPTSSKPGLETEAIGPDRVHAVLTAAGVPGVGIGGITPSNARHVLAAGAGIAVLSAVMGRATPAAVVRHLAEIRPG